MINTIRSYYYLIKAYAVNCSRYTGKPQANPNQSNTIRLQTQLKTNTKEQIAIAAPSTETNQKKWHGTNQQVTNSYTKECKLLNWDPSNTKKKAMLWLKQWIFQPIKTWKNTYTELCCVIIILLFHLFEIKKVRRYGYMRDRALWNSKLDPNNH